MRRIAVCLAASLALVLTVEALAASAGHQARSTCGQHHPRHYHIIAADGHAQVYAARRLSRYPAPGDSNTDIFACAYGRPEVLDLGYSYQCGSGKVGCYGVLRELLAGSMLAYERAYEPYGMRAYWHIVVRDLRSGRVLHRLPTELGRPANGLAVGWVTALVVKPDGAVAWIAQDLNVLFAKPQDVEYEVNASDRSGTRRLASGTGFDPNSLALAGSTLYWTQGGKPYSATLN